MNKATGRCLCGTVKFSAEKVETHHHACHCGMCRRWSSGPMMAAVAEHVQFEGEDHLKRFDSSQWAQRGFCDTCGSHLFYYLKPAGRYFMAVGTFDNREQFHLAREIYIDQKPPGYGFAGDLPKQTEAEILAAFGSA